MQCVYYRDPTGVEPVRRFLEALPAPTRALIMNQLDRMNEQAPGDPPLPFPWTSQVEGELREFRAHHGRDHYRFLYRRSGNLFVLLHALAKRSGPLPSSAIVLAKQRWADFKARMNAVRRMSPRAAGHDAP